MFQEHNHVGQKEGRKGWLYVVQHLNAEKAKPEQKPLWSLFHGSSSQRRSSFLREERDRKQGASERSTVQLGMALEREPSGNERSEVAHHGTVLLDLQDA